MEQKRLCPYCMGGLPHAADSCVHCGKVFAGATPAGCLPVGTVLAGRYTVGEMRSLDGEGILYRGVENLGGFRVTIKGISAGDPVCRAGRGLHPAAQDRQRGAVQDHPHGLCRPVPGAGAHHPGHRAGSRAGRGGGQQHRVCGDGESGRHPAGPVAGSAGRAAAPDDACSMLQPVFEGVAAMHKIGLVHRGICPENLR